MKIFNIFLMLVLFQFTGNLYATQQTSSVDVITTIPVSCKFSNVSSQIIIPENGGKATGNFNLNCNKNFELRISSKSLKDGESATFVKSENGKKLRTLVDVNFIAHHYQLNSIQQIQVLDPSSSEPGTISISLETHVNSSIPAGLYQDVLYLDATF
ncbi:hypothetical protein [Acinetobacter sp. ANC 3813]|uniref:hypothetical protein n=1 Tax=Acinetobacter sp. ANC 3813 TaxID=1977873 RepID=UPI000A3432C8|nr:hypothetical protein [Acinetobacter sp. ANC 3813]OTG88862.1 hypothetical protein B9T34_13950 [Acinetobacter sp. ANC 3813]